MVVIDEKSLGVEGRWPWPRSKFAPLIDLLARDGARTRLRLGGEEVSERSKSSPSRA
jgi:CHASE2 domain